ncbi:MAG TPA: G1 family glutamic endopeptidase [Amycolatopsis sp.]|uniref:G1 family glutamic endopeptidase n=1 Tax=Amycolatopsis sp. TaxID=37632 RepID=UPI002B48AAB7|nr:G1 family glutamic endopeptidase [Amycolatopsis sp.]HKS47849.1 G1 family glutamic endopeptidase [Amycolatopsis sp.]
MKRTFVRHAANLLAVVAASTASVGTSAVATPVFGARSFSGGNWGGYVSFGSFTTATASWTEPSVTCTSTDDVLAPWVGIDGDGSSTVEQTGVVTDCSSGSPVYQAWYEMYPAAPVYYSNAVGAGDKISATVTRTGTNTYQLTISDTTKGWSRTVIKSLNSRHSSAEAIIESPTDRYPGISGGMRFTGVRFNGTNLADTSPSGLDADDMGLYTWSPSAIASDGTDFTMTRH